MNDAGRGYRRRKILETTVLGATAVGVAGCMGSDNTADSRTEVEPEEPPEVLRDGVDIEAIRDRTASAIAEDAFTVTGVVSSLRNNGDVDNSQAKRGHADPNAEKASYTTGWSREKELEEPTDAASFTEWYYTGDVQLRRYERDGVVEFGRRDTEYSDFVQRIQSDLDSFYAASERFEFGDPVWDEDETAYVIEDVDLETESTEIQSIEECRLYVNADGVLVGISATLDLEASEQLRVRVDGTTRGDITVEEPEWTEEAAADLPVWSYRVGEQPSSSVRGKKVYASSSDGVVAIDRFDGVSTWEFPLDEIRVTHTVDEETVFVGTTEGEGYALDRDDGTERWNIDTDIRLAAPKVIDDFVVFNGLNGIAAFERDDGTPAWSFAPSEQLRSRYFYDGTIYVGNNSGTVYAIDATTGAELWAVDAPTPNWVSPQAVADGRIYAGGFRGSVYAFNVDNGDIEWQIPTDDAIVSVQYGNGSVFAGNRSGEVYALNAQDGTETWTVTTGDTARPYPHSDSVYIASHDGSLYRVSADNGETEWTFDAGGFVENPTITDDAIYISSRDSHLYAVDPETGTERWQRDLRFWARSAPTVVDDLVYAMDSGRGGGIVYAFDANPE